jgi:hypothetical protein
MALYISAGKRRQRAIIGACVAALLSFGIGLLVGRQQVPSITERVDGVQADAADIATGLERLDIEYDQVLTGGDDLQTSVLQPLDDLRGQLQSTMDRAPWLSAEQRSVVLDSFAQVDSAANANATSEDFTARLDDTASLVRLTFGVSA